SWKLVEYRGVIHRHFLREPSFWAWPALHPAFGFPPGWGLSVWASAPERRTAQPIGLCFSPFPPTACRLRDADVPRVQAGRKARVKPQHQASHRAPPALLDCITNKGKHSNVFVQESLPQLPALGGGPGHGHPPGGADAGACRLPALLEREQHLARER